MCANRSFSATNSLRYVGPSDTSLSAISVTEGAGAQVSAGREFVVTGPAANNFGFVARWGGIFGRSGWTLYQNADFSGASICAQKDEEMHGVIFNFSAVIRGCGAVAEEIRQSIFKNQTL